MKEKILLHWIKDEKGGYWVVDKYNYPSRLTAEEIKEYEESQEEFEKDWDKLLLDKLIKESKEAEYRDFWVLQNDQGKYFAKLIFPPVSFEQAFTSDVFLAASYSCRQLAEMAMHAFDNVSLRWPAEMIMREALGQVKPVHVKAKINIEITQD